MAQGDFIVNAICSRFASCAILPDRARRFEFLFLQLVGLLKQGHCGKNLLVRSCISNRQLFLLKRTCFVREPFRSP